MRNRFIPLLVLTLAAESLAVVSCGNNSSPATTYTVGGTVVNLAGTAGGLVLQDNLKDASPREREWDLYVLNPHSRWRDIQRHDSCATLQSRTDLRRNQRLGHSHGQRDGRPGRLWSQRVGLAKACNYGQSEWCLRNFGWVCDGNTREGDNFRSRGRILPEISGCSEDTAGIPWGLACR